MNPYEGHHFDNTGTDDPFRTTPKKKGPSFFGMSYESYYEGYTEYQERKEGQKGKGKRRLVYTAPYYRADLTALRKWEIRLIDVVCYLISLVLLINGFVLPVPGNSHAIGALLTALSLICMLFLAIRLISHITAPELLIARRYHDLDKLQFWLKAAGWMDVLNAASAMMFALLTGESESGSGELSCCLLYLTAVLPLLLIQYLEGRIHYDTVPNNTVVDAEDAYDIEVRTGAASRS